MPKEQINYPKAVPVSAGLPSKGETALQPPTEPEFTLHWQTNAGQEYVQLGCDFDVATVRDLIDGSPGTDRLTIYSDVLDRGAMQRLIRAARRARDAVHGADE